MVFNNCHSRNRDRDAEHEINSGDDDSNPTQIDASRGWSRNSREGQGQSSMKK